MSKNKPRLFEGAATALVTPFEKENQRIDEKAFRALIEEQIDAGIAALVIAGTTGEVSTLTESEHKNLLRIALEQAGGRVPIIAGCGSNDTEVMLRRSRNAAEVGCQGLLLVTPYYNKATPSSLAMHYKEIAKSTSLPVILYNVPSRTGVSLGMQTLKELGEIENIVGVKEASGDVCELERKIAELGDKLWFYTGCDELILPSYSVGAVGVISAVANVIPKEIATLCAKIKENEWEKARELTHALSALIKELYAEVNPIPVKCALSQMGLIENELRLPLAPSSRETQIACELIRLASVKLD